jgi:excisionase family DNA binding protein
LQKLCDIRNVHIVANVNIRFAQSIIKQFYLTKRETAAYMRCSLRSVDSRLAHGELRAFRVGRKLLFLRGDLDNYIQRHVVGSDLDKIVDEVVAELREAGK